MRVEQRVELDHNIGTATGLVAVIRRDYAAEDEPGEGDWQFGLPVYPEIERKSVRKELRLRASQETDIQEAARAYSEETGRIGREMARLTADQMNAQRPAFQVACDRAIKNVRHRIKAVLSAEQLAALNDRVSRIAAFRELTSFDGPPRDTPFWGGMGLSSAQADALVRLRTDSVVRIARIEKSVGKRVLTELSPAQSETLREELDQLDWAGW